MMKRVLLALLATGLLLACKGNEVPAPGASVPQAPQAPAAPQAALSKAPPKALSSDCQRLTDQARLEACAQALLAQALPAGTMLRWPEDGTVFPPDLAQPSFLFEEVLGARSYALLMEAGPLRFVYPSVNSGFFPPVEHWGRMKRVGRDGGIRALLLALDGGGRVLEQDLAGFTMAADPVGDSLFFREVPLPFSLAVKDPSTIRWRFGAVASRELPRVVMEGLPVCANCHSFSRDGKVLGLDVDYANDKGNYAMAELSPRMLLTPDKIFSWSDFRRDDGGVTFGLLSQVSPDGRYAISTVKDRSVFVAIDDDLAYSQLFFPVKGILAFRDSSTGELQALPGADDPDFVQSNPVWAPDGSWLLFAKAPKIDLESVASNDQILLSTKEAEDFIKRKTLLRYDLMKIPFNGGKGGKARPLLGASANGSSNYFPKVSPDGRWVVFCKADSFMLLQPDSKLFIVPAEGGEARELEANRKGMNSWHSWSSNGRWLVFASKAEGRFTRLLLTHIDAEGRSSPPILLDWLTASDRAANIPEFVPMPPEALQRIDEDFLDEESFMRAGQSAMAAQDFLLAVKQYRRALELNPQNPAALQRLGMAILAAGDRDTAESILEAVLRLEPENAAAKYNLALLKGAKGDAKAGLELLKSLEGKEQELPGLNLELAKLYRQLGQAEEALGTFRKALEQEPDNIQARYLASVVMLETGRLEEALAELDLVVAKKGDSLVALDLLATAQGLAGRYEEAAGTATRALEQAKKEQNEEKTKELEQRLELYKAGKAWVPSPKAEDSAPTS